MDAVINIRIEKKVRDEAKKIFSKMGLSTSAGINMFLKRVIFEKGMPFKPTVDTKKLRAHLDREVADALKNGKSYRNAKELFADLK